jgi:hypothetical protein
MSFFETLGRALGRTSRAQQGDRSRLAEAWGIVDSAPAELTAASVPAEPQDYDHAQWRKKLKRILDKLPASTPEWETMMTEARAMSFGEDWVVRMQVEEFALLMRRAVADGVVTEEEHRKIDLARTLMGISEADAEALLHTIVTEAETFFGHSIEGA